MVFSLVSPGSPLAPLIGCVVALCSIWLGWRAVRAPAKPCLLKPVIEFSAQLVGAVQEGRASLRKNGGPLPPDTVRAYGYAWMYAGALGLIVAGVQLARLVVGS